MMCDADRSGILTINEMPNAMATLGFNLDMNPSGSFYTFLKAHDFDKSGRFSLDIFIAMVRPDQRRSRLAPPAIPLTCRERPALDRLPASQYVTLFNAQRVHMRLASITGPQLSFDVRRSFE